MEKKLQIPLVGNHLKQMISCLADECIWSILLQPINQFLLSPLTVLRFLSCCIYLLQSQKPTTYDRFCLTGKQRMLAQLLSPNTSGVLSFSGINVCQVGKRKLDLTRFNLWPPTVDCKPLPSSLTAGFSN